MSQYNNKEFIASLGLIFLSEVKPKKTPTPKDELDTYFKDILYATSLPLSFAQLYNLLLLSVQTGIRVELSRAKFCLELVDYHIKYLHCLAKVEEVLDKSWDNRLVKVFKEVVQEVKTNFKTKTVNYEELIDKINLEYVNFQSRFRQVPHLLKLPVTAQVL